MISILVVDDHPVVREALAAMLTTQPDMQVVAEADTGSKAITRPKPIARMSS
jgi:DNA-binding NarL/FixJ family response regulator